MGTAYAGNCVHLKLESLETEVQFSVFMGKGDSAQVCSNRCSISAKIVSVRMSERTFWKKSGMVTERYWFLLLLVYGPIGSFGKEFTCNVADSGSIPRMERSRGGGHGNPLQGA